MTTDRPYRRAMDTANALAELRSCAGTQFDPAVIETIERLIAS
jgi:HD-GYP domain-containing protein (c-di-GMP phosphodiesterase class II)